ncbi:ATP-binding protein [Halosimplex halobium]|uniref:ATP-binding protein n=1 Tax=Halosimplex halobium TaxID=3396618 RepID=UPI003F569D3E
MTDPYFGVDDERKTESDTDEEVPRGSVFDGKNVDARRAEKLTEEPGESGSGSKGIPNPECVDAVTEDDLPIERTTESQDLASSSDDQEDVDDRNDDIVPRDSETETGPGKRLGDPIEARPYIQISPAREQTTPGNVISGLFGLYRAGVTKTSRFNLKSQLGLKDYDKTFEFIIHKPRDTKRFDFYLSATPYDATSFKTLAANIRAMYPESFEFEIVPFNPVAAFSSDSGNARVGGRRIAALEDITDLEHLNGFEDPEVFEDHDIGSGTEPTPEEASNELETEGVTLRPEEVPPEKRPSLVRWKGISMKNNDWMTLLRPFSDIAVDRDEQYRSPLSVLLEQAVHTDSPFVFQAIFKPRKDWTKEAEVHKRNLKMGNHGTLSAFKNELARQAFGTSEQERRNIHRGDISEQVGGSVSDSESNKISGSRMTQIDHKQPTTTFDLSLRAACDEETVQSISNAFTSLSGPYYGIEGDILLRNDKEFARLCHSRFPNGSGLTERFKKGDPVICSSPDELANFVVVPHTDALPRASRGSSGGSPDARSPLTATDEDLLSQYSRGMNIGYAETAVDNRPNIPIRLSAEQLTHHVLRAATTGGGKTTAMINDALSAHEAFDGPTFIFDKKGGSMSTEYKRAHFKKFGSLDNVVHIKVPGPEDEVLAFPYFDIRPQLAAGVSRSVAIQEKVDRYNELLVYVLGDELTQQAFVAQEILNSLIKARFDPAVGDDAWKIEDLFEDAKRMQGGDVPFLNELSDRTLQKMLERHLNADPQRFQTSMDAVLNRITKLAEREFIWKILNFVPDWDDEAGCYAEQSPMFDIQEILDSKTVVIIDTGDLRPASSNLFTFMLLDYIWSGAQLRHRVGETPTVSEDYVINLIIDEAAPLLQSELVRDDMIPDGREFGLSLEVIIHFAEQVKSDALDVSSYKEILRNINTKLIGKLAVDDELIMTLFHEGLEDEELVDRITSLPRGEWVAQLPDTGFMTDIPELVTLLPVDIPEGHSDSEDPVMDDFVSPHGVLFSDIEAEMVRVARDDYCLIPGSNTEGSPEQYYQAQQGATTRRTRTEAVGNEVGTQLGTGTNVSRPAPQQIDDTAHTDHHEGEDRAVRNHEEVETNSEPSRPDTSKESSPSESDETAEAGIDEDLTVEERHFLSAVVTTVNGQHPSFDLLDSMTHIKSRFPDIDLEGLEELGYLEKHNEIRRTYYTVTREGQRACGAMVATGENQGDVNEKTFHKVMVEAFARSIDADPNNQYFVTKYTPLNGGTSKPDVVAYDGDQPAILGEAISNVHPSLIVKHYDDYHAIDAERKVWIVPHISVAWEIARALANEGRIISIPPKREGKTYDDLNAEVWGSGSEWEFMSARKLIHDLE